MLVKQLYHKNQIVIINNDAKNFEYVFQSYDSQIAKINKNGVLSLSKKWSYSQTTLKHLYLFMIEYKNQIKAEQYKNIFTKDFEQSKNKKQFIENLINKKIIKINLED